MSPHFTFFYLEILASLQDTLAVYSNPLSKVHRCQLDILTDAIIPYMKKMSSRLLLDKQRFSQIQALNNLVKDDLDIPRVHPSQLLEELDKIIEEIKATEGVLWGSELAVKLQVAVK